MNDWNLQHPLITHMMQDGTPDGRKERYPICPCCGEECDTAFVDQFGDVVGCENCMMEHEAWERPECFPDEYDEEDYKED